MSDWSYYYGMPRSQVHLERYGTPVTPPRQYRMGGGRARLETSTGDLIVIGLILLGLYVITKKR